MRELLCDEGRLDVRGCGEENGVLSEGGEDAGGLGGVFFLIGSFSSFVLPEIKWFDGARLGGGAYRQCQPGRSFVRSGPWDLAGEAAIGTGRLAVWG